MTASARSSTPRRRNERWRDELDVDRSGDVSRGGLQPRRAVEPVGNRHELLRRPAQILRVAACVTKRPSGDPVTQGDRGDIITERIHGADEVLTGGVRDFGEPREGPGAQHDVVSGYPRRLHSNTYFTTSGRRCLFGDEFHPFRRPAGNHGDPMVDSTHLGPNLLETCDDLAALLFNHEYAIAPSWARGKGSQDRRRWPVAVYALRMTSSGVGTLRESQLHAALKEWYAEPGDRFEVPIGRFVIDIVRNESLIEIQTSGFAAMRRKLDALLDDHPMRIVHPIAGRKWIVRAPHDGRPSSRRKSPKQGSLYGVFAELVSFPWLLDHPNLTVEVLLTDQEELRRFDGNTSWRRKGWSVVERRLLEVTEHMTIESPSDLASLLPADLAEPFTTADLSAVTGQPRRLVQQMAYCLREAGVIEIAGKTGNAMQYRRGSGG